LPYQHLTAEIAYPWPDADPSHSDYPPHHHRRESGRCHSNPCGRRTKRPV